MKRTGKWERASYTARGSDASFSSACWVRFENLRHEPPQISSDYAWEDENKEWRDECTKNNVACETSRQYIVQRSWVRDIEFLNLAGWAFLELAGHPQSLWVV